MALFWDSRSPSARWLGLVTAIWVQSISGNNYTFSNYSDALKVLMGLTQLQLNGLSVAKDLGKAFGLLAGLASDTLPTPVILLVGSVEGVVGYGAQWLVVSRTISPLPYWQMCVFLCMGGNSSTWLNTAVLVTCMRNFRSSRGPVSGILKGYVGLSTAIFTDLCASLFSATPSSFLLMLALLPLLVCLSAMLFLHEHHLHDDHHETRYFNAFSAIATVIAFYLLAFDLLVKGTSGDDGIVPRVFAVGLFVLLALPLCVPMYVWLRTAREGTRRREVEEGVRAPLVEEAKGTPSEGSVGMVAVVEKEIGEEHTVVETVATLEFWVLFASFLCGVGTGMAVQNNMGQMGVAMGYADVSTFVSLISIFGFFGRIGSGVVSEHFLENSATPRPVWNAASQILMIAGYLAMALALPGSLYVGSIVVGLCYGIRLAITVPTASELFGLRYYGIIYNILILNLPLGSFLFSGLLAGFLYDAEATETAGGGNTCVGVHCYRLVFLITSAVCVAGFLLDVLLVFWTKKLYKKISASNKARKVLS